MSAFHLLLQDPHWINGAADDIHDLCLHGRVTAHIGEAVLTYDCALNAAGIYLLRTLEDDHIPSPGNSSYEPLLPCCGHELFACKKAHDSVVIFGCGRGVTWEVRHENADIRLTAEGYPSVILPLDEYRCEIFRFCDEIKTIYQACSPKQPESYEMPGYNALWNEWHRRRNA